jgi:hypothetical protein
MMCATCPHDCEHTDIQEPFPAAPALELRAGLYTNPLTPTRASMSSDDRSWACEIGREIREIGREIGRSILSSAYWIPPDREDMAPKAFAALRAVLDLCDSINVPGATVFYLTTDAVRDAITTALEQA